MSELFQMLKKNVDRVGLELERVCSRRIESNMTNSERREKDSIKESVPIENLLVLEGFLDKFKVRVPKYDRCNTNVVSHGFFQTHCEKFHRKKCNNEVSHSKKGSSESRHEVMVIAALKIGNHSYESIWLVTNCRYDVLLRMHWHVSFNPSIDYQKITVSLGTEVLCKAEKRRNMTEIMNVSEKCSKICVARSKQKFQVFN